MVKEAMRDCPGAIVEIYTVNQWESENEYSVFRVSESVFLRMSSLQTPQGILAVLQTRAIPQRESPRKLLLDGVADPGNLGTILRTAEAFGFSVYLTPDCADPLNPKSLQASMGSLLRAMPVTVQDTDIRALAATHRFIGASLEGSGQSSPGSGPLVLVLGSEAHGIRPKMDALLHERIRIAMVGQTESLNVAVAGGILMHALANAECTGS